MESLGNYFGNYLNRQKNVRIGSILDFTPLSRDQKQHLCKVYSMVIAAVFLASCGVWFHTAIFRIPAFLASLASIGCIMALAMGTQRATIDGKVMNQHRLMLFGGFSFFMGASIGNLVSFVNALSPAILPFAFFASLAIFTCFSIVALMAKERSYLFLGSILSSVMFYVALVSFFNVFFGSHTVDMSLTYLTLFIYLGYVVYDTQVTLEEYKRGNRDILLNAVELFMDLFGIFVRLLIILAQREQKNKKNERQN